MKKISFWIVLVSTTVVLIGCNTFAIGKHKPVERRFMDRSLQIQEHSILNIDHTLMHVSIDGKRSLGGVTSRLGENSPIVLLVPGIHRISAIYADITGYSGDTMYFSRSGEMSMEFDFKAGHVYRFYPTIEEKPGFFEDDSVRLAIVDETEPLVFEYSRYRYDAWHRIKDVKKKLKL
jgi:hypothetical protein